jgi:hypothetical protein
MIKTEAVQTAIAEITVQAILNPTPISLVKTIAPSVQDQVSETPDSLLQTDTPEAPMVSPTPPLPEPVYSCAIDQSLSLPQDGPQPAGIRLQKTWVVKNTGNVAWTSENIEMKWLGGVNLGDSDVIGWPHSIKPGETYAFKIDMIIPERPTDKMQIVEWGLVNQNKDIFCKLYFLIPSIY